MSDPLHYRKEDAFYGPLGDFTRLSADGIEADPLTLYAQLLTIAGHLIGRRAKCMGGDSEHHCNLFTLIVGDSAVGKGGTWNRARRFFEAVEPSFLKLYHSDVQSAPALIRLVTDEVRRPSNGKKNSGATYEVCIPAVTDKRCLIINQEMQSILTAKGRNGATLGQTMKNAWDGETLENNTKDQRGRATHPHVSLIGHITPMEFAEALSSSKCDRSNGFYNRMFVVVAKKRRSLPHGSLWPECTDLIKRVKDALEALGPADPLPDEIPCLEFDDEAKALWEPFYHACGEPDAHPFFDGLTGFRERLAKGLVKRVALIHAVLDQASAIKVAHLKAAIAFGLQTLDGLRPYLTRFTGAGAEEDKTVAKLRAAMQREPGEYTKSQLWQRIGRRPDKDKVALALRQLVESSEWTCREREGENGQVVPVYRPADLMPTDVPAEGLRLAEVDQPMNYTDDGHQQFDGHRFKLGRKFKVEQPTCGYCLADKQVMVNRGDEGYLANYPDESRPSDKAWLDGLAERKPRYQVAWINGTVLLLPP